MEKLPNQQPSTQAVRGEGKWFASPSGTIRINCDASWCKQTGMGGVGVIARDSSEQVVGGLN